MSIDLLRDEGTPVEQQRFTWKEMMHAPFSKLDTDAFTRVRAIMMCARSSVRRCAAAMRVCA